MFRLFQSIVDQSREGFDGYEVTIEDVWPDGWDYPITLPFHWVGRNSSHYFAISTLKDGRIVYLSRDYEEDGCHVCNHNRPPSYFGHW
jgi:hypothetical protein